MTTERLKAATLAVGTEVTQGQITDRNSAWISQMLVREGFDVIEHRAVADDRPDIARSLRELGERVDLLFVTGGLGPTSDDFTREVLADVFGIPLEFQPAAWQEIQDKLGARGVKVREIQKQQAFFPRTSRILPNSAGTANAFAFDSNVLGKPLKVYALPGPPNEIAAVWAASVAAEVGSLVPSEIREDLVILRCLGKAESEVAEITEAIIKGHPVKVGYRAHLPYVEAKIWYERRRHAEIALVLKALEKELGPWLVGRNEEDLADAFVDYVVRSKLVRLQDQATSGLLQERLAQRVKDRKIEHLPLVIETSLGAPVELPFPAPGETVVGLTVDEKAGHWLLTWKTGEGRNEVLELKPPYVYNFRSDRDRRYVTERALHAISLLLAK